MKMNARKQVSTKKTDTRTAILAGMNLGLGYTSAPAMVDTKSLKGRA